MLVRRFRFHQPFDDLFEIGDKEQDQIGNADQAPPGGGGAGGDSVGIQLAADLAGLKVTSKKKQTKGGGGQ